MNSEKWIDCSALAELAGITLRQSQRLVSRKSWLGQSLIVTAQRGRGGASGKSYLVRIDSLPPELRIRAEAMFGIDDEAAPALPPALPGPTGATGTALAVQNHPPISLPAIAASATAATSDWEWCMEIIRPALRHPVGSPERAEVIRQLAAIPVLTPGGERRRIGERTLRQWLSEYEKKGVAGLRRKPRSDRGGKRVVISRAWDDGVPFEGALKAEIAAKLTHYVKRYWKTAGGGKGQGSAKTGGGWKNSCRLATKELIDLTREAGFDASTPQLLSLCEVPRSFVEKHRNFAILALKANDAKKFFDEARPRTHRTRAGMMPMELVVGDVHHMDVYLRRADGSLFTPKIIGWLDVANNRMFMTLAFVEKGKMIRQEHIIQSFIDMTQNPEWGMPQALYLDNGGEYKKLGFVDDAMKLTALVQHQDFRVGLVSDVPEVGAVVKRAAAHARRKMVVNAQPYNAPAKPIEGIFAVLEGGPFAMLPGWIGGNRMTAKTKNVGKEPTPHPGTEEDFRRDFKAADDYYHTNRQGGSLKGQSPREVFAAAVEAGWKRTDVDPMALQTVFAIRITRVVSQGEFSYRGVTFRAPELLSLLPGTKVTASVPLVGDKNRLPVFDEDGKFLCIAEPALLYGFLDPAGARERGRRVGEQNLALKEMGQGLDDLDLVKEMGEAAALHPAAPIPESGGTIRLSDQAQAIAQATKQLPATREQARSDQHRAQLDQMAALERFAALAG